jgi:predicted ATPase/DNA-binding CsgD family transcriptional regulator
VGVAAVGPLAGVYGFTPALTSFVGRAAAVNEVAELLNDHRLVTVTGPGGVGKTRLAGEVARRVAGRFADGVWLVELAAVTDPLRVPSAMAAALGLRERPGVPLADSLTGALAGWQVLLVLDNCEHVIATVAGLCEAMLLAADDARILTTSREPVGVSGETRYRLPPLGLPARGQAEPGDSEAVSLFADRARQVDPHFRLSSEAVPLVTRLVERLDGMPLAIELAAARTEALGLAQLLDRLDDGFRLLVAGDRLATARHQSLDATVDWSYQLLNEEGQRVFRWMSVFPAPFTLEGAEAVAGADAGPVALRLVDCSLLAPPRTGADGQARYLMMETLRAYGAGRLADAGEAPAAAAALARYALQIAEQSAAGMQSSAGELAAAHKLDAEDATVHQVLTWALQHDAATALRMAIALAPWWQIRGRMAAGYPLLRAAAGHAVLGSDAWNAVNYWLGRAAYLTGDFAGSVGYFTAICDAAADQEPPPVLVDALAARSFVLLGTNRVADGIEDARQALALARKIGHPAGEALALFDLSAGASYTGNVTDSVAWAQQAQGIGPAGIPGWIGRLINNSLMNALLDSGDVSSAWQHGVVGLVQARDAGDVVSLAFFLVRMASMAQLAGCIPEGWVYLRESVEIATRVGHPGAILNCLDCGGELCAATQRWAEAVTVWAAIDVRIQDGDVTDDPQLKDRRQALVRKARQALGPARTRAAEQRGAAMTLPIAAEFLAMVAAAEPDTPAGHGQLSPRERELVSLVAQGRTDAQIASQLYISVRTVRSHLDRIRDKTECRRRADLTRLALREGLI